MRKVFSVALMAAMLCLVGMTRDAGATITISLEWSGCGSGTGGCTATGTDTITVNPGGGQTLRLDIYMATNLTQGIKAQTFSLNFDTTLENELNLGPMAQIEWLGTDVNPTPALDIYGPLTGGATTLESTGVVAGRVNSYDSGFDVAFFLPANSTAYTVGTVTATAPARYRVAQAFFTTNGALTDGADIFTGAFNGLFDEIIDGLNIEQNAVAGVVYGSATLNVVPEPGTISLLGLGLVGLILAGRRSRRS